MKHMLLVLRKTHTFFVLLMEHGKHNFPFLIPLCSENDNKMIVLLQRCYKSQFCAPSAQYGAHFFVLLMQRENHISEIDLTPSVTMIFC